MEKELILGKLKQFLVDLFEVPEEDITLEANLSEDLDLDSIDAIDLIVKLQELTGQRIRPDEFKSVRTVQDVVDRVYDLFEKGEG